MASPLGFVGFAGNDEGVAGLIGHLFRRDQLDRNAIGLDRQPVRAGSGDCGDRLIAEGGSKRRTGFADDHARHIVFGQATRVECDLQRHQVAVGNETDRFAFQLAYIRECALGRDGYAVRAGLHHFINDLNVSTGSARLQNFGRIEHGDIGLAVPHEADERDRRGRGQEVDETPSSSK
jgi:hypothetical protein